MAQLSPQQRKRTKKRAKRLAAAQTNPAKRTLKTEKKANRRTYRRQLAANDSLMQALLVAMREAQGDIRGIKGLTKRDKGIALSEIASRKIDTRAGAVLARKSLTTQHRDTQAEVQDSLRDVAAQKGDAYVQAVTQLMEAARSRAVENQRLRYEKKRIDQADERLDLTRRGMRQDAQGESAEEREKIESMFNEALSTVKSGRLIFTRDTENEEGEPTRRTQTWNKATALAYPKLTIDHITSQLTDGNRRLAQAVFDRWAHKSPSSKTVNYAKEVGLPFGFTKYFRKTAGPAVPTKIRLSGTR